jgi:hypothetical protein
MTTANKRPRCQWCGRVIRSRLPSPKVVIVTVRLHRRANRKAYHQHLVFLHELCALQAAHELIAIPLVRSNIANYDPLLRHFSTTPSRS